MSTREREKAKVRKAAKIAAAPRASLRNLRMSPSKVRLVVDLVRGQNVVDAEAILTLCDKKAARHVLKLLRSAVANAEEKGVGSAENLKIKTAFVDEGPVMKRWNSRAQGRACRILKRTSDITIILDK